MLWRLKGLAETDPVRLRVRIEAFNGSLRVRGDEGQGAWKTLMLGVDGLGSGGLFLLSSS